MEKGSNGEDMHFVFAPQGSWHMLATETMETVAFANGVWLDTDGRTTC